MLDTLAPVNITHTEIGQIWREYGHRSQIDLNMDWKSNNRFQ